MPRKKKVLQDTPTQPITSDVAPPPELPPEDDIELPPDNPLCPIRYMGKDGVVRCGPFDFPRGASVEVPRPLAEKLIRTGNFEAA